MSKQQASAICTEIVHDDRWGGEIHLEFECCIDPSSAEDQLDVQLAFGNALNQDHGYLEICPVSKRAHDRRIAKLALAIFFDKGRHAYTSPPNSNGSKGAIIRLKGALKPEVRTKVLGL